MATSSPAAPCLQLNIAQMQIQSQNELIEALCRQLQKVERDNVQLASSSSSSRNASFPHEPCRPASKENDASSVRNPAEDPDLRVQRDASDTDPMDRTKETDDSPRPKVPAGPSLTSNEPYFGSAPGLIRRMSTIGAIGGSGMGNASLPPASIDMSDLNNLVRRLPPAYV